MNSNFCLPTASITLPSAAFPTVCGPSMPPQLSVGQATAVGILGTERDGPCWTRPPPLDDEMESTAASPAHKLNSAPYSLFCKENGWMQATSCSVPAPPQACHCSDGGEGHEADKDISRDARMWRKVSRDSHERCNAGLLYDPITCC